MPDAGATARIDHVLAFLAWALVEAVSDGRPPRPVSCINGIAFSFTLLLAGLTYEERPNVQCCNKK